MARVAIITSLDYELFGDCGGVVQREQIIPTSHIANIYDLYGAKLTIMFDYGQFRKYKEFAKYNPKFKEDNQKIKEQLVDLVKRGHDVQLHYHPQWHYAKYNQNSQKVEVDLSHIDISSLSKDELESILKEGKEFLENLLKPYSKDYECIAFRAGSWAVRDEKKLIDALKKAGFKADSSVVPNVKFESENVSFKYSNCPSQYHYWFCKDSLSKVGDGDFIEIPNFTLKNRFAFLKYFNSKYLLSKRVVTQYYRVKISEQNYSKFKKLKKIINRDYYMADINTMSYKTLIKMVEYVLEKEKSSSEITPLMFIGHPKVSYGIDDLYLFFEIVESQLKDKVEFWSFKEAVDYISDI